MEDDDEDGNLYDLVTSIRGNSLSGTDQYRITDRESDSWT